MIIIYLNILKLCNINILKELHCHHQLIIYVMQGMATMSCKLLKINFNVFACLGMHFN